MSAQINKLPIENNAHQNDPMITELPLAKGPGRRLKSARENQGHDIPLVAAQLHLTTDMIIALECDDYSQLPAKVFVRGYLRNYARFLKLDEQSILLAYQQLFPLEEENKTLSTTGIKSGLRSEISSSHQLMKMATFMVVLALIGLFITWWVGYLEFPENHSTLEIIEQQQIELSKEQTKNSTTTITDTLPPLPKD